MADPLDFETLAAVRTVTGLRVQAGARRRSRRSSTRSTATTRKTESPKPKHAPATARKPSADLEHLRDMASEAPVIRLVNAMIAQAVEKRASDIHIEPFEKDSASATASTACC